jgi:hypothetical protein
MVKTGKAESVGEAMNISVITSKPAIHDHLKTGQRNYSGQEEFYRILS